MSYSIFPAVFRLSESFLVIAALTTWTALEDQGLWHHGMKMASVRLAAPWADVVAWDR